MSCISLAGWSSGVFNAVKLLYSVSTSGPSATVKPISEKIEEISSMTWDTGCIFPCWYGRIGNVTSTFSFFNLSLISAFSISKLFCSIWLDKSSLILFKFEAKSFLLSGSSVLSVLNCCVICPFFPKNSVLIFCRSSFVFTESIFALNTELILSKSLIR